MHRLVLLQLLWVDAPVALSSSKSIGLLSSICHSFPSAEVTSPCLVVHLDVP